ncbi:cytidine deaminase-like fold-containing protein [Pectobacterium brasiliense]|uniref:cytidine deaminase-like fold-containing protein n=1 Tax=Pectobacterium brasiliense TaxID=180957 RepID=UPI0025A01CE0|nr:VENN motif pre-toxin domain-containing protein [Pectobacterium brasiliense]WJM80601.1 VENN motif pre-toxin domain-containing protein [Pectobacterium brasiliense]
MARDAFAAGDKPNLNPTEAELQQYVYQTTYDKAYTQALNSSGFGTGGAIRQGIMAVSAAVQGLAGGNVAQAIAGAAAPYLATEIKKATTDAKGNVNIAANAVAHAVLGGIVAEASGNSALAGAAGAATGELAARVIADRLYPGKAISEMTESEKQTVTTLSLLAGGLAAGTVGNSTTNAVAGAQASQNAVDNNFLSVSEKSELEIAKQKLKYSTDPAEREKAEKDVVRLTELDISRDGAVIEACGNGGAGSAACAAARFKVYQFKAEYENTGNYNSRASQQYADAYGQIVNLLNITSVDAQNQQQVTDAIINYFMVHKIVDYETAKDYVELKKGAEIVLASVTPILGEAAAKQLSKIVDANLKVVAKGNVDGAKFSDTNQGARPSNLADVNKPTLIDGRIQAKIEKQSKSLPNGNMATAHAEVGVIQQAFEKGMTKVREMTMSVSKEPVCGFCRGDVAAMADKAGLKSLTIYEETTGSVLYWQPGMKSLKARD